jgi:hypothetical protein
MIVLRDCVQIPAPPEVVWDWLEHLPDHILEWHPDHLGARWVARERVRAGRGDGGPRTPARRIGRAATSAVLAQQRRFPPRPGVLKPAIHPR